jgi:signal transduction histidine kinase
MQPLPDRCPGVSRVTIRNRRLAFAALLLALIPASARAQAPAKRVLVVYSHEREMAMYAGFDRALRARLQADAARPVEFYTEYLDLMRFAEPIQRQKTVDYFRVKYSGPRIDLIVTVSSLAFDFILEHGDAIFPGIPIVFASVNALRLTQATLRENITGVAVKRDIRQTVDLLLAIQPDTRQIVVPAGSSPTEKAWTLETRELFRPYESRVRIEFLSGLSMDAMLRTLGALPAHSAVLFTPIFYYDAAGQYFLPDEALASIAARSAAPVYGTDEAFLGWGIVGGVLYDLAPVGDAAGRLGERVLKGDAPASIPVETIDSNSAMFDARQLERFQISKARLPAGSVIRFDEPGTWERHKFVIVGAVSLVIFEAALIGGLIAASARRRRAEASLRASHVQVRELAGRLITAQEQERARIARELHDDVCQRMALLGIELTRLRDMLPHGAVDAKDQVRGLDSAVATLAKDVQGISHQLHSSKLEYFGLAVAADYFCKDVSSNNLVPIEYIHEGVPANLDQDVAISLFRVLQEALSNVMKHSGARHCCVTLRGDGDEIKLHVIDDGRGFDAQSALRGHGLGLVSMRERLRLVNGDVFVDSEPGAGTTVRASAPMRTASAEATRSESVA